MQEYFSFLLPGDLAVPQNNDELGLALKLWFQPGNKPYELLITALTLEIRDLFGSPVISSVQFEVKRYDPISLAGRVRINYHLQLTFSCSGIINEQPARHSYWNFNFDKTIGIAYFKGEEYGDLRSTHDEF